MKNIVARAILEVLGSPKDHVEKALSMVVENIDKNKNFKILKKNIFEPKQVKQFWSTFAEVEFETKSVENLFGFCFDFMPSSLEVIEPSGFAFEANHITNMLNDLLERLHRYDMYLKNMRAQLIIMKRELEKKKK